jgi:GH43 family beta-xylosidase
MKKNLLLLATTLLLIGSSYAQCTFTNQERGGADPYVIYSKGYYYYLVTTGEAVWIHKSETLQGIQESPRTLVWQPTGDIKSDIWAPELHYLNGKWYIYASGTITADALDMRMFVCEGNSQDPLGSYTYKGLLSNSPAIDESVWQDPEDGKIYMTWSQWDPEQSIFIAEMTDPTTLGSTQVKLSEPTNSWERNGWPVNEGPIFIKRNNKLHITFSVSGCSTPDYALALLSCSDGNYLNAGSWTKSTAPVFSRADANGSYGPGHNSFTKSPDGCEDWIVYHAKISSDDTNDGRTTRIQKFTWSNSSPVFGEPVNTSTSLTCPSTTGSCNPYGAYNGPHTIPGTIQAEDFNTGGQYQGYYDMDYNNNGGSYRTSESVDVQDCGDTGGGYNLGWVSPGEWTEYIVNVEQTGTYELTVRAAWEGSLKVEFDGNDKTGDITIPNTGGLQTYADVKKEVYLDAGEQLMRITCVGAGYNLNYVSFSHTGGGVTTGLGDGLIREFWGSEGWAGNWFTSMISSDIDETIDDEWGGSPADGVGEDYFNVRWHGFIEPLFTETYTFCTSADDGSKLWINDQVVVDDFPGGHAETEMCGTISLQAGQRYTIKLDYAEQLFGAACRLYWSSTSQTKEIVPKSQLYTDITIGTQDYNPLSQVKVYPNPATDLLIVTTEGIKLNQQLLITDLQGRTVYSTTNGAHSNIQTIDISKLQTGIYFLTLKTNSNKIVKKFVKQ